MEAPTTPHTPEDVTDSCEPDFQRETLRIPRSSFRDVTMYLSEIYRLYNISSQNVFGMKEEEEEKEEELRYI